MAADEKGYGTPIIGVPSVREQLAAARAKAHGEHKCNWCSRLAVMEATTWEQPPHWRHTGPSVRNDDYACFEHIRDLVSLMVKLHGPMPHWL